MVKSKNLAVIPYITVGLAACSLNTIELSYSDQQKLDFVENAFISTLNSSAQECMKSSPLEIVEYVMTPGMLYSPGRFHPKTQTRKISEKNFYENNYVNIQIHESIHQLDIVCGLLDRNAFIIAYNQMDSDEFPIKDKVKSTRRISRDAERIADFIHIWLTNQYEVPKSVKVIFSSIFRDVNSLTGSFSDINKLEEKLEQPMSKN